MTHYANKPIERCGASESLSYLSRRFIQKVPIKLSQIQEKRERESLLS